MSPAYAGNKIEKELGFEYKDPDWEVTLRDAAQSMIDLNIVPKYVPSLGLTHTDPPNNLQA